MNQESVSFQSLGLEKVGLCCSGVREGLWKLVAFELVSERFNRHSEDIGICEKLFWKQQIRFSLGWMGGKEIWDGELAQFGLPQCSLCLDPKGSPS